MEVTTSFSVHTDVHTDQVPYSEPVDITGGRVFVSQRCEWVTVLSCKVGDTQNIHVESTWTKPTDRQIRKWKKGVKKP